MSKFLSRRWSLAVVYTIVSSIALFTGHLSGSEFVTLAGVVLALYNAANYLGKRNVD
jgi:hydrogenase/urease accessory protein HupE